MANKTFTFPDGGKCYVEYSGEFDNIVRVSADPNEGEDRELTLTFQTYANGISVQRKVVQEGAPYTFDLGLITSSECNVATQLGWKWTNGVNVAQPFTLNGETYNANTTNYWTNGTDNHVYNVTAERAVGKEYVFYANPIANYENITGATLRSTMPSVNLVSCFNDCYNLVNFESGVVNVTNMALVFYNCRQLASLDGLANWNVARVTNMYRAFQNCNCITTLDPLANWNTGAVLDMEGIFIDCFNITALDGIANWDTAKVSDMASLVSNCQALTTLKPLANWNVANVSHMNAAFRFLWVTTLEPLANWNVAKVSNMSVTFYNMPYLTNLDGIAKWNVESVTNMASMFRFDYNLVSAEGIANWRVGQTDMCQMFDNCTNLTTHGFNSWTGANANCSSMFRRCNSLDDIQIHWNITNATDMFSQRNAPLNVYASTVTNAYNQIYLAMGNSTTNSDWNVTLYELNE